MTTPTEPIESSLYLGIKKALEAGASAEDILKHRSFLLAEFWQNVDAFFADLPIEPESYPEDYDNAIAQIDGFMRSHLIALGAIGSRDFHSQV